mmetsp:Transcript_29431/g.40445  ORF Transcript_29431/g.40445 Transcript_29431/m.40445 type:complete len:129 (+) Transcript_29431:92-478(+)
MGSSYIVIGSKAFLIQQIWQPGVGCVLARQAAVSPASIPNFLVPSNPTFLPVTCPTYSASNTSSATQNYATCTFKACAGLMLKIEDCGPSRCGGSKDQYIRRIASRSPLRFSGLKRLHYGADLFLKII